MLSIERLESYREKIEFAHRLKCNLLGSPSELMNAAFVRLKQSQGETD